MNIDTIIEGIFEGKEDIKIELRTKKSNYDLEFDKIDHYIGTKIILNEKYSDIAELEEKIEKLEDENESLKEEIDELNFKVTNGIPD
ncbi:MAG: hypothetical protein M0R03_03885 [Novosphingobium sp.]|nr:hypothetical protein [Novosphingobium sp.]